MTFKNSNLYNTLKHKEVNLPFGNYYFFDTFLIAEINDGIHFDWEKAELTIQEILKFYGKDARIGYISNRTNNYSIDPQNWIKSQQDYNFMIASAIVAYEDISYKVATLEKHFSKKKLKRCHSIEEAITWIEAFDEHKEQSIN